MSGPFNIDERLNKSDKATQAAAETGTDDTQWMSPLNVKDAYNQYGLGKTIASSETLNDTLVNGFFRYTSLDPDSEGISGAFATFVNSPAAVHQIAFQNYTNNIRTRNKNNSDVWSDWVAFYHTGNLLGTVSQSAGDPTGAIIERGSNANGDYIKFADGTLICTQTILNVDVNDFNSWIGYQSARIVWTYPSSFIVYPAITISGDSENILSSSAPGATESFGKLFFTDTLPSRKIYFIAIGRWY